MNTIQYSRWLAIDPGPFESAYVIIDQDRQPVDFNKLPNDTLRHFLRSDHCAAFAAAIEMVASYGMPVGAEVFETCVWIGRFFECLYPRMLTFQVPRKPVKLHHCGTTIAKDSNIRRALVDRFTPGQPNHGKGTSKAPGWFHGFNADVWQAYALAVYAADTGLKQEAFDEPTHAEIAAQKRLEDR